MCCWSAGGSAPHQESCRRFGGGWHHERPHHLHSCTKRLVSLHGRLHLETKIRLTYKWRWRHVIWLYQLRHRCPGGYPVVILILHSLSIHCCRHCHAVPWKKHTAGCKSSPMRDQYHCWYNKTDRRDQRKKCYPDQFFASSLTRV